MSSLSFSLFSNLNRTYDFSQNFSVVTNAFFTQIKDLLTYSADANADDFYINSSQSEVYGFESGLKYKNDTLGYFDFTYSFYQAQHAQPSQNYQAFQNEKVVHSAMNLGFPTHKATLNHTFNFTPNLSFNHNLVFFSDRFGYSGEELKHYAPDWIYNAYLRYQNMPIQGAEVGLGLYDVFNSRYQYVQQYNGAHPALPAEARELMLRLSYKF